MKVVHFHNPGSPSLENELHLFAEKGIEYVRCMEPMTQEEQIRACEGADAVLTIVKPFPREVIEKLDSSVKCIVRIAMGYEIVDVEACSERGIYVCNIPDYAMEEVAVHQTALILACLRKVVYYDRKVREGAYDHVGYLEGYSARRIYVLSVGLLGFGRIAKNVARYMQSFGASVYAYDPLLPDEVFAEHGVTRVRTKEEIFRTCDIITPNIPLMESSYHIIDAEAIAHMKDGVIIVNTGRGALVDTEALLAGLQSGKVKAAGLDVHETEPFHDLDHPFMIMENVVLTPHIAVQTTESVEELQHKAVLYAIDGAMGKISAGAVNGGCVRP